LRPTCIGAKWEGDAVVVLRQDRRQIVVAKDAEQVGLDGVAVSSDHANELPIWYWSFRNGAREVCYQQETVHGGFGVRYELREVATGKLLAQFEPGHGGSKPAWVEELEAADKARRP
jgi:hypothetical protein